MGRAPRIQTEDAIYYISIDGDNDNAVFKSPGDRDAYLDILSRYKKQHKFKLYAYFLAPSNINLLIEPSGQAPISLIMHDINANYTRYFNKKDGRSGHLFKERYRVVLVEKDLNLLKVTIYTHSRPKLMTPPADINTYEDSSYPAYLKKEGRSPILDITAEIDEVMSRSPDKSYAELVNEMTPDELKKIDGILTKNMVMGSDKFVLEIKAKIREEKQKTHLPKPAPAPEARTELLSGPGSAPEPVEPPVPEPEPLPETISEPAPKPVPAPNPEPEPAPDGEPGPAIPNRPGIINTLALVILILITISGAVLFVNARSAQMKAYLNEEMAKKDAQLQQALLKEREAASKELRDKLNAEKAKYEETVKSLESDKDSYKEDARRLKEEMKLSQDTISRLEAEIASRKEAAARIEAENNQYKQAVSRLKAEKMSAEKTNVETAQ